MSHQKTYPERVLEQGPVIGLFLDSLIYAWVRLESGVYDYRGIAPGPRPGLVDISRLRSDEVALSPGLLYRFSQHN